MLTRSNGNLKRLPANTCSKETTSKVTTFITNYTRAHGKVPGHCDKVMFLSSDINKALLYQKYNETCEEGSAVGRSKFYRLWRELLPHIAIYI